MKNFKKLLTLTMLLCLAISATVVLSSCDILSDIGLTIGHQHDLSKVAEVAATCTDNGTESYYICSDCDKLFADAEGKSEIEAPKSIDKLAHSFTNYVSNGDATCAADGTKTAKCDRCDVTDTVADEGSMVVHDHTEKLTIENVYAWVGYPDARFFPVFSKEQCKNITYEYDSTALTINEETNSITALKAGNYVVTAKTEHFSTTFTVKIEKVDKTSAKYDYSKFEGSAQDRASQWKRKGIDGETTLFIGDSFFDTKFWSDFYSNCYNGKDALCLGIGSTTTYDWEQWLDEWLGETSPKNIVMHIGTNNVYDVDNDNVDSASSALQRLFTLMNKKFPDTHIYWFGISQRTYDDVKIGYVAEINVIMQKWCDALDFITYIDTPSQLTGDMLKDRVHPKLEYYSVFTSALAKTDIVINDATVDNSGVIDDVSFATSQTISKKTGLTNVEYKGANLAKNYVLSGKLDIISYTTNSHIQFGILNNKYERILIWDNNSKGEFRLCIPYNNDDASVPVEDRYIMKDGETLTIEWKIVYHENNLYFFIGGELKLVYAAINNPNSIALTLGSEQTDCKFYDMQAVTLANDAEAYQGVIDDMADIIDAYDDITEYQKIRV